MNSFLDTIDTQFLLSIDIETVRIVDEFDDLSDDFKIAFRYKLKNDDKVPTDEELRILWIKKASLYAEFSRICALSFSYIKIDKETKEEDLYCKEFFIESGIEDENAEAKMLVRFGKFVNKLKNHNIKYHLVGHAAHYFDYPFICKRFVINGLRIPKILDELELKPWQKKNICTNKDIWKMGGDGPGSSLVALCVCLGIPISKGDMFGDEVGAAFFEGDYKSISRYCSYDAVATFNIVRRLKQEKIFDFKDVKYV